MSVFFLIIYSPFSNGYQYIYDLAIRKMLIAYEEHIDKYLLLVKDELHDKAKRVKKTVVEQLAD